MVAPVVFLFIFGMVEFGRMLMVHQGITYAAREGSRMASLATTRNQSRVEDHVRTYLESVIPNASSSSVVRLTLPTVPADTGTELTVRVEVDADDVSWLPGTFINAFGDAVLRAESTDRRE